MVCLLLAKNILLSSETTFQFPYARPFGRTAARKYRIMQTIPYPYEQNGYDSEIELGVTGGEEDGVDNSDVDRAPNFTPNPKM